MLDFFQIGRKIQNIFKNIFPIHFQLIVSKTSLIKFLLYPLEQESSVTFACLTFLLYSFRLDRIFTLHSLLYQDRLYTFSLFFVIICFTSLLSSCTLPAQRFELWTNGLRVRCSSTELRRRFPGFILNAPDVIRTRDIRFKRPLPYRLATDANQYSVFGISPFVFVLFFSLSLSPFFCFFYMLPIFILGTSAGTVGLVPTTPWLTAKRSNLLSYAPIFLYGQKTYPPITYSQNHMLNGAYGNRTRRLLLAKQASPQCD